MLSKWEWKEQNSIISALKLNHWASSVVLSFPVYKIIWGSIGRIISKVYWVLCCGLWYRVQCWVWCTFLKWAIIFVVLPISPYLMHYPSLSLSPSFLTLLYILSEDDTFLRAGRTREVCKSGELVMELATCVILFSVILITFWVISCKRQTGCAKPPIKFVLVIILDTNFENNSGKGRKRKYRIECVVCKYVVW